MTLINKQNAYIDIYIILINIFHSTSIGNIPPTKESPAPFVSTICNGFLT
jgi:hypothetical protein